MKAPIVPTQEQHGARPRPSSRRVGVRHRRRLDWRPAAAFLALALIASCDLIAGVDDLVAKEPCETAADCGPPDPCHEFTCQAEICISNPVVIEPGEEPIECGDGYGYCDKLGNCLCPTAGCEDGAPCDFNSECKSGYCAAGQCQPSPCGGPCPGMCWECAQATNTCVVLPHGANLEGACPEGCDGQGNCQSCANEIKDVDESDEDCGGPTCPGCLDGQDCEVPADCQSCLCDEGICRPIDCGNGDQDGCESDVDCGGPCGSTCAPGEQCNSKQDCATHDCKDGICQEVPE